jgi:hypothetical protein
MTTTTTTITTFKTMTTTTTTITTTVSTFDNCRERVRRRRAPEAAASFHPNKSETHPQPARASRKRQRKRKSLLTCTLKGAHPQHPRGRHRAQRHFVGRPASHVNRCIKDFVIRGSRDGVQLECSQTNASSRSPRALLPSSSCEHFDATQRNSKILWCCRHWQ